MMVGEDGKAMRLPYTITNEIEYENETYDEKQELCEAHKLPICNMRRFEMIKYSFGQDKEYVPVKEMNPRFSKNSNNCMPSIPGSLSHDGRMMDGPRERNISEYWWRIYISGDLKVLES
ncbi:hypothetical protein Tco_0518038 [Tanacetum coccineum]